MKIRKASQKAVGAALLASMMSFGIHAAQAETTKPADAPQIVLTDKQFDSIIKSEEVQLTDEQIAGISKSPVSETLDVKVAGKNGPIELSDEQMEIVQGRELLSTHTHKFLAVMAKGAFWAIRIKSTVSYSSSSRMWEVRRD